ncbi:MAG: tetratricopeptide repeat protein [Bacteroidia bacterium]|nr:tetratricopeptide repeat protein [Bacteroidia bacterium]NNF30140.1 tetratricopeptide repeat protein [Flavobacteriaceae bacterium]MBT8275018.1 tetratricopeptide repeat protein [Bacteroidia bacterium]NNJ81800.1 tetratricopeptide repeat protein [Flavobacteriaceae bacterium]NNK55496.1 tetratricopeptide repeat protein [Flavobacteriaceae bacterium]
MATYKKRGYKPKNKAEKQAQLEDGSTTAEVFKSLDEGASKTEAWVEKNQKYILGVVGAIAIAVLGYIAYQQFIQEPKEIEATNEMFKAQEYYELAQSAPARDSLYNLSLNGGEGKYGFLDIIDNYGGTSAGNRARYYAGMAYLNLKDYQQAINFLDDYKGSDEMTGPLAKGAIGDAFVQLGQNDEALKYYEEAANMRENSVTSPRFLLKAGITALNLGQADVALAHFKAIEENYPEAPEAAKAIIYVGKAEAMQ